jgi:hypothetical protein
MIHKLQVTWQPVTTRFSRGGFKGLNAFLMYISAVVLRNYGIIRYCNGGGVDIIGGHS